MSTEMRQSSERRRRLSLTVASENRSRRKNHNDMTPAGGHVLMTVTATNKERNTA